MTAIDTGHPAALATQRAEPTIGQTIADVGAALLFGVLAAARQPIGTSEWLVFARFGPVVGVIIAASLRRFGRGGHRVNVVQRMLCTALLVAMALRQQ